MKQIPLTQDQVALVDDEDYEYLNQWKWYARWDKETQSYYAVRKEKHPIFGWAKEVTVYMHRQIMNTPKGLLVDHIDHDTLKNIRSNLRNVTVSQNNMNLRGAQKNNKLTGALGIALNGKGFRGTITVNGKQKRLPTRRTIEEAIADRKAAEKKYYGEFAGGDK